MSVITAYKSDADGRIFEDKAKYQRHLRKLAKIRNEQRKVEEAYHAEQQWWYDNFWNKVKSLPQLQAAILIHAETFGANGLKNDWGLNNKKSRPIPRLVKWDCFNINYSDKVCNSHSCPVDGETNWGGYKKDVPLNYPGWSGRFDYTVEWFEKFHSEYPGSSDMFKGTRIHTGTGGGGGFKLHKDSKENGLQSFGYSVEIFAADWPGMAASYAGAEEERAKLLMWHELKTGYKHGFVFDIDAWVNEKHPAEDYK